MKTSIVATAAAVLILGLTACGGGGSDGEAADAKTTSATPTPTSTPSETAQVDSDGDGTYDADDAFPNDPSRVSADDTADATASEPESQPAAWNLPKGYPKVVLVSSLPFQVKSWYEMDGTKKAVAVAPGVWAPISPGSSMDDAIEAGVFDGFCGSKKAFEKKYLGGEETAGTCW